MTSEKNATPAGSKSPKSKAVKPETKPAATNGGGVKLPNGEKHTNGAVNGHAVASGNGAPGHVTVTQASQGNGTSQANGVSKTNGNSHRANHAHKLSGDATAFKPKPAPISLLNVNSTVDGPVIVSSDVFKDAPEASTRDKGKAVVVANQQPIGTRGAHLSPSRPPVFFTTDVGPLAEAPGGHYIKITGVANEDVSPLLESLDEAYGWSAKLRGQCAPPSEDLSKFSTIYLCFDDVRDAASAFGEINTANTGCNIAYNSQTEYANARRESGEDGSSAPSAFYDGQVVFMAHLDGSSDESSISTMYNTVYELAKERGRLLAFGEMTTDVGNWQFRAEYYSIIAAKQVAAEITPSNPEFRDGFAIATKEFPSYDVAVAPKGQTHYLESSVATPHRPSNGAIPSYTSPSGRTAWRVEENGVHVPLPPPKRVEKVKQGQIHNMTPQGRAYSEPMPQTPVGYLDQYPQGPRNSSWSGPYQSSGMTPYGHRAADADGSASSVDVANILNGRDVRTTVMLRNLPNDIGFLDLKRILDHTSFGKYDFSYLRVDFTNNLNVGYGFVNFTDPVHIIDFVTRYVGYPWIPNHPSKGRRARIADVSYATVQGYDCLVEKFRNSAVMDEFQDFRPKLWWATSTAPDTTLIGTEREFPPANNDSKKQRSRDNASTIGLYQSGNRRKANSTGGRTRQSQWDRGTPAQIEEDAYYNQAWQQMSPLQPGYPYSDPQVMYCAPPMPMAPPPSFPTVNYGHMNGYMQYPPQYAGVPGVMDPMSYGHVQFTDPFTDQYGHAAHAPVTPGRLPNNGRFNGYPNYGPSPRSSYQGRFYHRGMNGHQIPKAIMEEMNESYDPSAYPSGGAANGHNNNYPPPQY